VARAGEATVISADDALDAATARLTDLPPAAEPVAALPPPEDHDWCFVVYWTLARNLDGDGPGEAPPPGFGPIVIDKETGQAWYLGSQNLPDELADARAHRDRRA
jgi:hypothetical protein